MRHKQASVNLLTQKSARVSKRQKDGFPWTALGLFVFGNIVTGACLWLIGASPNTATEPWLVISTGIFSAALAGLVALVVALVVDETVPGVVALVVALIAALVMFVADTVSGAWAVTCSAAMAGIIAWSLARVRSWHWAMIAYCTVSWAQFWAVNWYVAAGVVTAAGVVAGVVAGFLGSYWVGANARDTAANWAGIGGSATALAGLSAGWFTTLLDSAAQSSLVTVLCLFQIVLMVKSLKSITQFLSARFRSTLKPFAILNSACMLGILCGAGIAWAISSMANTTA